MTVKLVLVWNIKGGVGKTSLSLNIFAAAQKAHVPVCIIDLEGNDCVAWARRRASAGFEGQQQVAEALTLDRFEKKLRIAAEKQWLVIVNAPGERRTPLIEVALNAASIVVVPTAGHEVEMSRTRETIEEIQRAERDFLIVLNKMMPRVSGEDARQTAVARYLFSSFEVHLWEGQVTRSVQFEDASKYGVSVVDYRKATSSKQEILALWGKIQGLIRAH